MFHDLCSHSEIFGFLGIFFLDFEIFGILFEIFSDFSDFSGFWDFFSDFFEGVRRFLRVANPLVNSLV